MNKTSNIFFIFMAFSVAIPSTTLGREILYSKFIPKKFVSLLTQDQTRPMLLAEDTPDFKDLLGVKDLHAETLREWLTARVGFIIGENEDPAIFLSEKGKYQYQNPDIFPDIQTPAGAEGGTSTILNIFGTNPAERVGLIMKNAGSTFYIHGKKTKILLEYGFQAEDQIRALPVESPRVGIIQIGEGLFIQRMNEDNENALSNSIYRMAILFHEAHHGDGNGKSLAFPHALCPRGSPYFNTNSCDKAANGPYAVAAFFIRQALIACLEEKTCDEAEEERLAIIGSDFMDRTLSDAVWDSTPEGVLPDGTSAAAVQRNL